MNNDGQRRHFTLFSYLLLKFAGATEPRASLGDGQQAGPAQRPLSRRGTYVRTVWMYVCVFETVRVSVSVCSKTCLCHLSVHKACRKRKKQADGGANSRESKKKCQKVVKMMT